MIFVIEGIEYFGQTKADVIVKIFKMLSILSLKVLRGCVLRPFFDWRRKWFEFVGAELTFSGKF